METKHLTLKDYMEIGIAILALAVSLFSLITTLNLQTQINEVKLKAGAIKTSGFYSTNVTSLSNNTPDVYSKEFGIQISNTGNLSVDKVSISYMFYGDMYANVTEKDISVEPPQKIKITRRTPSDMIIDFDKPFPPGENITLRFKIESTDQEKIKNLTIPSSWFSTEANPTTPIIWENRGGGSNTGF